MKKIGVFIFVFMFVFICFTNTCFACTSFAEYSQKTYYGMNFDHYVDDIRFSVRDKNNMKVFRMDFANNGNYASAASLNNEGVFSACELVYPEKVLVKKKDENQMDICQVFSKAAYSSKVQDIRNIIDGKTLICGDVFAHTLSADASGDAMVLETDNKEQWMTNIEGKSIVMANFMNHNMKEIARDDGGIGRDRYKIAKDYIDSHMDAFSYEDGMTVLQNTIQKSGQYPTQSSMLFDPERAEVFIALKGDFTKIWKVSINNKTIETFKGFDTHQSFEFNNDGISAKKLIDIAKNYDKGQADADIKASSTGTKAWIIIAVCSIFVIGIVILRALKIRASK
jgi:hypothetical protein